jgi:hypothetical protein
MKNYFIVKEIKFSKILVMAIVIIVMFFVNLESSRAENSDSVFATFSQVTKDFKQDTFKTTTNIGKCNYYPVYPNNEIAFYIQIQYPVNPLFPDIPPEPLKNRNTLIMVIRNFKGVGTYTNSFVGSLYKHPIQEPMWYGNDDLCGLAGRITVDEFDSASNYIKGSFQFDSTWCGKASSVQRMKGTFRVGYANLLVIKPSNKFDLEIGKSVNLDFTLSNNNVPVAGASIYISDSIQTSGEEKLVGVTDKNGNIKYLINSDKITKEKLCTLKVRALKDGKEITSRIIEINLKFPSTCFTVSNSLGVIFDICAVGVDKWELNDEEPTLTAPKGVTINNILSIDGPVTIDTVNLGLKAVGDFYLKNIPLPGGKKGNFRIGKGSFNLSLLGETGLLTLLAFSSKESGCKLFDGYEIDITDIKLLGGRNAHGVEISATIKLSGLTKTCGIIGTDDTEFGIEGLVISSVEGISVKGFKVSEMGLKYPGFCLNEFVFNYDKKEDKLSIGTHVKFPICDIGGGFQIVKGALDSIGWSLEVKYPPLVVFAPTTIGMSGFYGSIEGFSISSEKPFGVKLGGILCDAVVPRAYSFKLYGQYIQPSFFEFGAEDISFFKVEDNWQVVGLGSGSVDFKNYLIKLKAELKAGTGDGETYYFKGNGMVAYSKKLETSGLAGQLSGELTIPDKSDTKIERWVSKKLGLPYTASAYARFSNKGGKTISGEIDFGKDYGNVLYSMNFDKKLNDPDFLFLNIIKSDALGIIDEKREIAVENTKNIDIKSDTKFALIIRNDIVALQSSKLTDPDGITYKSDVADKNVSYTLSDNKLEEYWTLIAPKAGTWKLAYTPLTPKDSIDIYAMPVNPKNNFSIIATQSAKNITITWDNSQINPADSVDIYFDNDTLNYDGEYFGTFPATAGKATIIVDESITDCNFYLFANLVKNTIIYPAYSNKLFVNPRVKYAAPVGIQSFYNGATGLLKVTWLPSTDPLVIGYIIKISDNKGLDSILTTVFKEQNSAEFLISGADGKDIQMTSFTEKGESGCPSSAKIINDIKDEFVSNSKLPIEVYPNPASEMLYIYFKDNINEICNIQIVNLFGEEIYKLNLNPNEIYNLDISRFANGVYYLKYNINDVYYSNKFMIVK